MKKILVIGSGGAGKSTFARRLGEMLGINVIHLDALYWQPGWVEPLKQEWAATVETIISMTHGSWTAIIRGHWSNGWRHAMRWCSSTCLHSRACGGYSSGWCNTAIRLAPRWRKDVESISIFNLFSGSGTIAEEHARRSSDCSGNAKVM